MARACWGAGRGQVLASEAALGTLLGAGRRAWEGAGMGEADGFRPVADPWEQLLELLAYDAWASGRLVAERGAELATVDGCLRLWAHVVGAQRVWLARIQDRAWEPGWIWPVHDLATVEAQRAALLRDWPEQLRRERAANPGRERIVAYRTSRGDAMRMGLHAIVRHVVNHGTHHRAQILQRLAAAGHAVPTLDLAAWPAVVHAGD